MKTPLLKASYGLYSCSGASCLFYLVLQQHWHQQQLSAGHMCTAAVSSVADTVEEASQPVFGLPFK